MPLSLIRCENSEQFFVCDEKLFSDLVVHAMTV